MKTIKHILDMLDFKIQQSVKYDKIKSPQKLDHLLTHAKQFIKESQLILKRLTNRNSNLERTVLKMNTKRFESKYTAKKYTGYKTNSKLFMKIKALR